MRMRIHVSSHMLLLEPFSSAAFQDVPALLLTCGTFNCC